LEALPEASVDLLQEEDLEAAEGLEDPEALMTLTLKPGVAAAAVTSRRTSLEFLGTTTLSSPRSPIHPSYATARQRADTTQIPRLSARPSTSAAAMAMAASPSTASSVQMEQSSNKSI